MAGRGFPSSGKRSRERDQKALDAEMVNLEPDEKLRGPDLPDDLWDQATDGPLLWPSMTKRWWLNWRKSPQSQTFTDTDWDFLLETALLHRRFVKGDASVAAELRLRVAKFGATPEDRMRLKIAIQAPRSAGAQPAVEQGAVSAATPRAGTGRKERILSLVENAAG